MSLYTTKEQQNDMVLSLASVLQGQIPGILACASDEGTLGLAAAQVNYWRREKFWCNCVNGERKESYYCDVNTGRHGWICHNCRGITQTG